MRWRFSLKFILCLLVIFALLLNSYRKARVQYFRTKELAVWARERGATPIFDGQSQMGEEPSFLWRYLDDEAWFPITALSSVQNRRFSIRTNQDAEIFYELLKSTAPRAVVDVKFSEDIDLEIMKRFTEFKYFNAEIEYYDRPCFQIIFWGKWKERDALGKTKGTQLNN